MNAVEIEEAVYQFRTDSVIPREWFLVPLSAIDDAVEKIKDGTIAGYGYDVKNAMLLPRHD